MAQDSWRGDAKCIGLDPNEADALFFPGSGGKPGKAREFCSGCPVAGQCIDEAITLGVEGFWSGTTYADRMQMAKFRGIVVNSLIPPVEAVQEVKALQEVTIEPSYEWLDTEEPSTLDLYMIENNHV